MHVSEGVWGGGVRGVWGGGGGGEGDSGGMGEERKGEREGGLMVEVVFIAYHRLKKGLGSG